MTARTLDQDSRLPPRAPSGKFATQRATAFGLARGNLLERFGHERATHDDSVQVETYDGSVVAMVRREGSHP